METKNNIGIWMDHSNAHLIEANPRGNKRSIASDFSFSTKEEALGRSENLMHNKRQQLQESYYKEIAGEILKYDHVLLFGPTNAKVELHNYLNKDSHFKKVKIDVESTDNISHNEQEAFVKKHFENA